MSSSDKSPDTSSVVLKNISKKFADFVAIPDLSLTIEKGTLVTFLGPSGCGKTTTLRIIAGLEYPTAGSILIGGQDVTRRPANERDVSMVFQSYALFPHMDVLENICYGLVSGGMKAREARDRAGNILEQVGLPGYGTRLPAELSGGQQQRVALARALVLEPQVLLLDEPLSNLDARLRRQMRTDIRDLQQRLGFTAVYVTHDQVEAMTLADRIVIMRDGYIEQVGTPDEVFQRPSSQFVASFIGTPPMNMAPATLKGGKLVFDDGSTLPVPSHFEGKIAEGSSVTFGLRPDNFFPTGHGLSSTEGSQLHEKNLHVVMIEPLGQETLVFVEFAGQEWVARMLNPRHLKRGEQIPLQFDLSQAHLFDRENGKRLF